MIQDLGLSVLPCHKETVFRRTSHLVKDTGRTEPAARHLVDVP